MSIPLSHNVSKDQAIALAKAMGATADQLAALDKHYGETTYTKADYDAEIAANPIIAPLVKQSSVDDVSYALSTGDLSGIVGADGKPFSLADQQAALAKGMSDTQAFYDAQKQKDTQDTEAALKQKQADYQHYLATQATDFQTNKTVQDQSAADHGVLFSGGRAQKLQNLQNTYGENSAYEGTRNATDIGNLARDYQYKYGNDAAGNLSQYYNQGGQNYNSQVPLGGIQKGGLSAIYNPNTSNFQGTVVNEQKANANKIAAGLLWNKGNKLVAGGYKNQY